MEKRKIRLMVVDDHPAVVAGIKAVLADNESIRVIGDALDGEAAIRKAKKLKPDIVLLDVSMPKRNGLDVMKELLPRLPETKFLIHTVHDDKELLFAFKSAGASGYILKSSPPQTLRKAILDISNKKRVFTSIRNNPRCLPLDEPEVLQRRGQQISDTVQREAIRLKYGFTVKEMEIVELILKGINMRQAAERLALAYYTITTHSKHIYRKLGVHTRAQAMSTLIGLQAD